MWCHQRKLLPLLTAVAALIFSVPRVGSAAAAEDPPPSLKISGKAAFAVEVQPAGDGFEIRTTLADEVGRPLGGAEVRLRASAAGTPATLHRCGGARGEAAGELLVTTDKSGRTCVLVTGMASGMVELTFQDARGYLERTSRIVKLPDDVSTSFQLGFDPPLTALSLDSNMLSLGLVVRARPGTPPPGPAELVLTLSADGSEREIGRSALEGLGEVHRMSLVASAFGQPGPARLVARLVGRGGEELAQTSVGVLRTATVSLSASAGSSTTFEPGSEIQLRATSPLGPASLGAVEAKAAGISVAVTRVRGGVATIVVPLKPPPGATSLSLEYLGESPGWLTGPPIELRIAAPHPGYARYALWLAAGLLTSIAVVLSWRRPPRPRPTAPSAPARGRPSIEVLETFGPGGGYRGFVRDAHDGSGVTPALVTIMGPGSPGPVLTQARTGADGAFQIDAHRFPDGARVEVTSPYHATLTAPLPVPGVIELRLMSRRRALLVRLVRWAEIQGRPWTRSAGEPTPSDIAGTAALEGEPQVEAWARRVELLAFGSQPPDASAEQATGVATDPKTSRERRID